MEKIRNKMASIIGVILMALSAIFVMPFSFSTPSTSAYADTEYAGLPSAYTQVEYIESNGNQYINSGIVIDNNSRFVATFAYTSSANTNGVNDNSLFGVGVSGNGSRFLTFHISSNKFIGYKNNGINGPVADTNWHTLEFGVNLTIDGVNYGTFNNSITNDLPLYVFRSSQTNLVSGAKAQISSFKIYSNNTTLVRDFIPAVRKSDSVAGLYDKVGKQFYTNQGTGLFLYGNVVEAPNTDFAYLPSDYTQLTYIESDGTQYINSGVVPTQNTFYDFKINAQVPGDGKMVFGVDDSWNNNAFGFIKMNSYYGFYMGTMTGIYSVPYVDSLEVSYRTANTLVINDETVSVTTTSITQTNPIYIFAGDRNGTVIDKITGKLYYLHIYDSTTLVRNFVPAVRKADGEVGLYDTVGGVFYTNQGTGTFGAGAEVKLTVPEKYAQLEYIESTGTQYIDSGVSADSKLAIEMNFSYPSSFNVNQMGAISLAGSYHRHHLETYNNQIYYGYGLNQEYLLHNYDNDRHSLKLDIDGNRILFDTQEININSEAFNTNLNYFVFARNAQGLSFTYSKMKIYNLSLNYNGELVRAFVPVLNLETGEAGLWDAVNDVFYGNAGSGKFAMGDMLDVPLPEGASSWEDVYSYTFTGSNATITGLRSAYANQTQLYIPAKIGEFNVVAIADGAFAGNTDITRLYFDYSSSMVTTIGDNAFEGCTNLTSAYLPASVTSVGDECFKDCELLQHFGAFGSSVSYGTDWNANTPLWWGSIYETNGSTTRLIITRLKSGYSDLTELKFPTYINGIKVAEIGTEAFIGNENITRITFYDDCQIDSIEARAFKNCLNLYYVTLPESVTNIGADAFLNSKYYWIDHWENAWNYTGTTSLTITGLKDSYKIETYLFVPKTIGGVPAKTFGNGSAMALGACQVLEFAEDSQVATIAANVCNGNKVIQEVYLPASLTTLNGHCFEACTALTTAVFAQGTGSVWSSDGVFNGCTKLVNVNPDACANISFNKLFFKGCTSLVSINLPASVSWGNNGGAYGAQFGGCTALETVHFAEGTTYSSMADYCFYNCSKLKYINLEDTQVKTVGEAAFYGCSSIETITFPVGSNVNINKAHMFRGCSKLEHIYNVNTNITTLPQYIFQGCANLDFSDFVFSDVTSVETYAFSGCSGFNNSTINWQNITTIGAYAFNGCSSLVGPINLSGYTKTTTEVNIFTGCTLLSGVTFPSTLVSIGNNAFQNCKALDNIVLPEGFTTLGSTAFGGCLSLSNITIPSTLASIGGSCFANCTSLVNFPDLSSCVITSIGGSAFSGCTALNCAFDFSSSTFTSIGTSVFEETKITSIKLPATLKTIGDRTFYNCRQLATVNFEELVNLTTIGGAYPFQSCVSLSKIDLRNTKVSSLGIYAFNSAGYTECYLPTTLNQAINYYHLSSSSAGPIRFYMPASYGATINHGSNGLYPTSKYRIIIYGSVANGDAVGTEPMFKNTQFKRYVPREDLGYYTGTVGTNVIPYDIHINLNANGGSLTSASYVVLNLEQILTGQNVPESEQPTAPVRSGYSFVGWYKEPELINRYLFDTAETKDLTIYAKWVSNSSIGSNWTSVYTYTLDSNHYATITGVKQEYLDLPFYVIPQLVVDGNDDSVYYTVKYIADRAFFNFKYTSYVEFHEDCEVVSIGQGAFSSCTMLQYVKLPKTLMNVSALSFTNDYQLTEFRLYSGTINYSVDADGVLYSADGMNLVLAPYGIAEVHIPNTCANVRAGAFTGMPNLLSVDLNYVSTLEVAAFSGCSKLVAVTVPTGMTAIPDYAFSECNALNSMVIRGRIGSGYSRTGVPTIAMLMVPSALQGVLNVYVPSADLTTYQASNWALYNLVTYTSDTEEVIVYLVQFDYKGGQGGITSIMVPQNSLIPVSLTPYRMGYTFDHFEFNNVTFDIAHDYVTSNMTLVAIWDAIEYKIVYYLVGGTYDGDEGGFRPGSDNQIYEVEYTLALFGEENADTIPVIEPSKVGHNFVGWYTNAEYDSARVSAIRYDDLTLAQIAGTQDIVLYAKWAIMTFDITFDDSEAYVVLLGMGSTMPTEWDNNFVFALNYTSAYTQNSPSNVVVTISDGTTSTVLSAAYTDGVAYYTIPNVRIDYEVTITGIVKNTYNVYFRSGQTAYSVVNNLQQRLVVEHGRTVASYLPGGVAIPTQVGYEFVDYNQVVMVDGEEVINSYRYDFSLPVTDEVIVTAVWNLVYYQITYQLNGGKLGGSDATSFTTYYTVEMAVTLPVNTDMTYQVTRLGYSFRGWWEGAELNGDIYDFDGATLVTAIEAGSIGAHEYVARWEINTYTITYNTNNGIIDGEYATTYTTLDSVQLPTPTYIGHTFIAWYLRSDLTGNTISSIPAGSSGNMIFWAGWSTNSYTVTYHLNGSELAPVTIGGNTYTSAEYYASYTYSIENAYALEGAVTRTGFTFGGWYDGDGDDANRVNSLPAGMIGNKEFWAKWNNQNYVINLNYGIVYTGPKEVESIEFTYADLENMGGEISLPRPSQTGYYFAGWYSGNLIVSNINTTNYNSFSELTAHWSNESFELTVSGTNSDRVRLLAGSGNLTPVYDGTIKFVIDFVDVAYNKSVVSVSYRMSSDTYINISTGADGYYTISNITGNIDVKIDGITLNVYTVEFHTNGGSAVASQSVEHFDTATNVSTSKQGYDFAGWYSDSALTTIYDFTATVTRDLNLYAKWNVKEYTYIISNNINTTLPTIRGHFSVENIVFFNESMLDFDLPAYTLSKFTRLGEDIVSTQGIYESINIVAVYVPTQYTIVYSVDFGQSNNTVHTYNVTTADIVLNDATKEGFTFDKWQLYDNHGGTIHYHTQTGTKHFVLEQGSYGDVVVTAEFHINSDNYYQLRFMIDGLTLTDRALIKTQPRYTDTVEPIEKEGRMFMGWVAEGTSTVFDFANTDITGNMIFNALYLTQSYHITYSFAGVTDVSHDNPDDLAYSENIYQLQDASKLGYEFGGWYLDSAYTQPITSITRLADNLRIFGKMTMVEYHITYFVDGGVNSESNPYTYNILSNPIVLRNASKDGYDFLGWLDKQNNPITTIYPTDCTDYMVYASFELQDNYRTVRYMWGEVLMAEEVHTKNAMFSLLVPDEKAGRTFDNWYRNVACTEVYVPQVLDDNLLLYAKYNAIDYTITYTFNKTGDIDNPNDIVQYNIDSETIVLSDASKVGYTFDGWYLDDVRITSLSASTLRSVILNGRFTPIRYYINYYDGGRSVDMANKEYTVENNVTLVGFVKTGYRFDNWTLNGEPVTSTEGKLGDLTLFAQLTLIQYDIFYTFNNKVGVAENPNNPTSYNVLSEITLMPATAKGYDFVGWTIDEQPATQISGLVGVLLIKGMFTPKTYTITYVVEEGTEYENPTTYTVESGTIRLNDARLGDRSFYGWKLDNKYVTSINSNLAMDLTLVADFEAVKVVTRTINADKVISIALAVVAVGALISIITMGRTIHKMKRAHYGDPKYMADLLDRIEGKRKNVEELKPAYDRRFVYTETQQVQQEQPQPKPQNVKPEKVKKQKPEKIKYSKNKELEELMRKAREADQRRKERMQETDDDFRI